ncbi:MAG: hypothetical protein H0W85_07095 [Methylotenera sp.]|nr:hypothetical protein [Methylotenera sp.]
MGRFKASFKYLFILIALPIIIFAIYTWVTLTWVYSSGERAGYVQKFSSKGYICKTWEGEIVLVSMPGTQAEKFNFTVKTEVVAKHVIESLGKRVRISYEEHKGIPSSCFGESAYFVNNIQVLEK